MNYWIERINDLTDSGNQTGLVYMYASIVKALFIFDPPISDEIAAEAAFAGTFLLDMEGGSTERIDLRDNVDFEVYDVAQAVVTDLARQTSTMLTLFSEGIQSRLNKTVALPFQYYVSSGALWG
mmetsp:Transcript_35025/g.34031  ORF Transcript_35025/g.34031 Transcript_35025/m.34031 type:complete len:124 (+) Transcript_35025:520-891(+)